MDTIDYKLFISEMISEIIDRTTYIKSINLSSKDSYSYEFYEGMMQGYYFVVDGIIDQIKNNDELKLEDFGLENFDIESIFENLPKKV